MRRAPGRFIVTVVAWLTLAARCSPSSPTGTNNGGDTAGGAGATGGGSGGASPTGSGGSSPGGSSGVGQGGSGNGAPEGGAGGGTGAAGSGAGGATGNSDAGAAADAGGPGNEPVGQASPHLFGSHTFKYPAGTIRAPGTQKQVDDAVAAFYDKWKALLVKQACGGYYVHTGGGTGAGANTIEVSEGHGYGMLVLPLMAGHDPEAQKIFDGMYAFFRKFPSLNNADLMDWEVHNNCKGPPDTICRGGNACDLGDSATDGDLDIAFGLLVANAQWGSGGAINYLAEARKVIAALSSHVTNKETHLILMGDWADIHAPYYSPRYDMATGPYNNAQKHVTYYYGTRPSDFLLDHFKAFGAATGDAGWTAVVDATYTLIGNIQGKFSPGSGLLPGFVEARTVAGATPARPNYIEADTDGDYDFNACRVPWRIATDYVATGEPRAKAAVTKMMNFIRNKTVYGPFALDGSGPGTGGGQAFEAPWGAGAVVDAAYQPVLDRIYRSLIAAGPRDYYGGSIAMMSLLVMSGNWFQPQAMPLGY